MPAEERHEDALASAVPGWRNPEDMGKCAGHACGARGGEGLPAVGGRSVAMGPGGPAGSAADLESEVLEVSLRPEGKRERLQDQEVDAGPAAELQRDQEADARRAAEARDAGLKAMLRGLEPTPRRRW